MIFGFGLGKDRANDSVRVNDKGRAHGRSLLDNTRFLIRIPEVWLFCVHYTLIISGRLMILSIRRFRQVT